MVGLHFGELPNASTVAASGLGAERTVAYALRLCQPGLCVVDAAFGRVVEYAYVEEPIVGASSEDVFEDSFAVVYAVVGEKLLDKAMDFGLTVSLRMVCFV